MPRPEPLWMIVAHRKGRAPSQRYRCEQYEAALEAEGFALRWLPLMDEAEDCVFYGEPPPWVKACMMYRLWRKRAQQLKAIPTCARVFIHREAFPAGGAFFERALKLRGCRLIFDFDDAIWLRDVSAANRRWAWLKRPEKTFENFRLADLVLAGNEFLAGEALRHARRVEIMPTTVDGEIYRLPNPRETDPHRPVVVGWSGSPTTVEHFRHALPALIRVKEKYGSRVRFALIGDAKIEIPELDLKGQAWSVEAELKALASFDIGIMPLPDSPWTQGKCGLKALTYLAFETPAVVSPVGVNARIIRPNENGFWAETPEDWENALSRLIEDSALRARLGKQGRADVLRYWSSEAWAERYVKWIGEV